MKIYRVTIPPTIYENTSGKYLQHPNRLSEGFNWAPKERVTINRCDVRLGGYLLDNIDYCGVEDCFETAFISFELFSQNFTPVTMT